MSSLLHTRYFLTFSCLDAWTTRARFQVPTAARMMTVLLGYCAVQLRRIWRTLQKCLMPESSGRWSPWWRRQWAPLERQVTSTRLHGAVSQSREPARPTFVFACLRLCLGDCFVFRRVRITANRPLQISLSVPSSVHMNNSRTTERILIKFVTGEFY